MSSTTHAPSNLPAILMMACAGVVIAVLWGVLRAASEIMHPLFMVFWRSVFGALVLAPFLMRTGLAALRTDHLLVHLGRSLFGFGAMMGIFYSITHIPLSQAMAINYSGPLFASIGAILLLGEKARSTRLIALAVGFAGMLVVLRPGIEEIGRGSLAAIFGAACMAGSLLCIKKLSATEANTTIIAYGNTLSLPVAFIVALQFWQPLGLTEVGWLILIGMLSTLAQWFMNRALSLAEASAVLPIDFLRIVFVTIIGAVVFAEAPDLGAWIGGAIILGSCVYLARYEAGTPTSDTVQPPPA